MSRTPEQWAAVALRVMEHHAPMAQASVRADVIAAIREAQAEALREAFEDAVKAARVELKTCVPPSEWAMWRRWIEWLNRRAEETR